MPEQWDVTPNLSSTVAQSGVADTAGTVQYQPDTQGSAGTVAFAGPIADFIQYGVVNGAFAQGPPDSTMDIDPINNPMPYWTGPTQVSGGAITCQWVVDASSPSGYNLRFTVNPGAASDEAYLEQIVPIGADRSKQLAARTFMTGLVVACSTATATAFKLIVDEDRLDAAGNVLATNSGNQAFTSASVGSLLLVNSSASVLEAKTAFLRYRLRVVRFAAAATDTATVDVTSIRNIRGGAVLFVSDDTDAVTYLPTTLSQTSGNLQIARGGAIVGINGTAQSMTLPSMTLELGHLTDTTLSRASAGVLAVEGVNVLTTATGQPLDTDLTTIAGLTPTSDNFMQAKSSAWASRTVAQVLVDLAAPGTTFQPLDTDLTTIAGLTATTNNFMQSSGSAWASRTPTQAGTTLSGLVDPAAHGATAHSNITRFVTLLANDCTLDGGTRTTVGSAPDLLDVIALADGSTQGCYWLLKVPADWDSGNVTVRPIWSPGSTDASAHTVRWSVTARLLGNLSNVTTAGTTTAYTGESLARTASLMVGSEADTDTSITPTNASSQFVKINIRRVGGDANDTYVGVVNLVAVTWYYTANQ